MFDGFWSGLFGGLFGTTVAQWLNRFKYRFIFLFAALAWQFFALILGIYYRGWDGFWRIFNDDRSSFLIIFCYAPVAVGISTILIAFLGSLNTYEKK